MSIIVRKANSDDLDLLTRFAYALGKMHAGLDGQRFVVPSGGKPAFREFFRLQLERPDAILLIAESDSNPVGYALVRIEPESLEDLRGAGAWLHDIYVENDARGRGIGRRLLEAAVEASRGLGSKSFMLSVSPRNPTARRLFEDSGLRATMIEMRLDFGPRR